jgi:transposase
MTQEEELHHLQETNAALQSEIGVLQAENVELRQQVGALTDRLKRLEEQLVKDSHTSHLPPSSDRFARTKKTKSLRQPSGKKPGAQPGHEGNTLYQVEQADQIIVHEVLSCAKCQRDLRALPSMQMERRQVVELPPKRLMVVEHQVQAKWCPACRAITKACFPQGVQAPVQYGPAFAAVAVYLSQQQLLPYARVCETIGDLIGPSMTVGTLKTLIERTAAALLPIEEQIKEHLIQSEVLHQDETSLKVQASRAWMHVCSSDQLTHYALHRSRGRAALDEIGIAPQFAGIAIHDGWQSYQGYPCLHALCNVHHLRELTFFSEVEKQSWASSMKELLLEMKAAVKLAKEAKQSELSPEQVQSYLSRYRGVLLSAHLELPLSTETGPPTKGRKKQSPARNLLDRFCKYEEQVLRFLLDFRVPFDNSQAERDIRMVKVQQKVCGGFRSLSLAHAFCAIRGYLSTLRKQGGSLLTALEQALCGHPVSPAFSTT